MGTKGRDLVIWVFYIISILEVVLSFSKNLPAARSVMLVNILLLLMVVKFNLKVRAAKVRSKDDGLKLLVTLPISAVYARWLMAISKTRIDTDFVDEAAELHVNNKCRYNPAEFVQLMEKDLDLLKSSPGKRLYIWETNVPVPCEFRQLIKQMVTREQAVWQKGRWPVPAPPLISGHNKGKYIRRGAIIVKNEGGYSFV